MPQFFNLSDAIKYQIQSNQQQRDAQLNSQSQLAHDLMLSKYRRDTYDPNHDALTWGASRWGQAKVINEDKPVN
jgi:hypothetical protein